MAQATVKYKGKEYALTTEDCYEPLPYAIKGRRGAVYYLWRHHRYPHILTPVNLRSEHITLLAGYFTDKGGSVRQVYFKPE